MNVYLFNPENDLALAHGGEDYCAPPAARTIAKDLSLLPMWYGDEDFVVISDYPDDKSLRQTFAMLNINGRWMSDMQFSRSVYDPESITICPWGWSPAVRKRFRKMEIPGQKLPEYSELESLKRLSNRSFILQLIAYLQRKQNIGYPASVPVVLRDTDAVRAFVEHPYPTLLKMPVSGSGKGLCWCKGEYNRTIEQWCSGAFRRQSFVMGEPVYDKIADFAMEFRLQQTNKVSFAGYSLFHTDTKGVYRKNELQSDESIEKHLLSYLPLYSFDRLKCELSDFLKQEISPCYSGYLGIDMMIYKDSVTGAYQINPVVEINLRMNMGVVARIIYDRYVANGKTGYFSVDYFDSPAELLKNHLQLQNEAPLIIKGGKIEQGYLNLTPIGCSSQYRAAVRIGF